MKRLLLLATTLLVTGCSHSYPADPLDGQPDAPWSWHHALVYPALSHSDLKDYTNVILANGSQVHIDMAGSEAQSYRASGILWIYVDENPISPWEYKFVRLDPPSANSCNGDHCYTVYEDNTGRTFVYKQDRQVITVHDGISPVVYGVATAISFTLAIGYLSLWRRIYIQQLLQEEQHSQIINTLSDISVGRLINDINTTQRTQTEHVRHIRRG